MLQGIFGVMWPLSVGYLRTLVLSQTRSLQYRSIGFGFLWAQERTSNIKAREPGNSRSALQRETEKDTFLSGLLECFAERSSRKHTVV